MNAETKSVPSNPLATPIWRTVRKLLIVASFLGLIAMNILTLVNDDIHAAGYSALKAILASAVAEATISRLLSNSPTQKFSGLEKAHTEVKAQHALLKRVSEVRAATTKSISKRIARRAVANAIKNVSSFAAEVVPVLGVAAIIALTLSDIYDDCQTLKDISELQAAFGEEQEDVSKVCGIKFP